MFRVLQDDEALDSRFVSLTVKADFIVQDWINLSFDPSTAKRRVRFASIKFRG